LYEGEIHLEEENNCVRASQIYIALNQCFPYICALGTLLASKNNHGSSHSRSRKYRVSGWWVSKIKNFLSWNWFYI